MNKGAEAYAKLHRKFLQENNPKVPEHLRWNSDVESYMNEIGTQADERYHSIVSKGATATGASATKFFLGGIIPMLIWALLRFRQTALNGISLLSCALILGVTFFWLLGTSVRTHGAELTCFANLSEVGGFYFIRFGVEQGEAAKRCDDTYALWHPPLFSVSSRVMASGVNQEKFKKNFAAGADGLAKRLGISSSDVFALAASRRTVQPAAITKQDCELLARKLQIRLTNGDDLNAYVVAAMTQEQLSGHICR
jgi:hypothetical protein